MLRFSFFLSRVFFILATGFAPIFWVRLKCFFFFNNSNIFNLKSYTLEVKAPKISLIYFSESSNIMHNTCKDVASVSYLLAKLNAELNIFFDLSENSLIKLSILKTYT